MCVEAADDMDYKFVQHDNSEGELQHEYDDTNVAEYQYFIPAVRMEIASLIFNDLSVWYNHLVVL